MRRTGALLIVAILVALIPAPGRAGTLLDAPGEGPFDTCTRDSVESLVRTFVRAYNQGDLVRLDAIWAPEPDFEWYSVSPNERERNAAYDRNTLIPYFGQRHALNDRLRLRTLNVGPPNELNQFGIFYRLTRHSDERNASGRFHGKAGAEEVRTLPSLDDPSLTRCALIVWSMGKVR